MEEKRRRGKKEWVGCSLHRLAPLQLRVALQVLVHANELQQLCDDFLRARHVPLGERALRRVPNGSREEVLGGELQLYTWVLAGPFLRDK